MSFDRYLLAAAAALRNDVLPVLPPSPARDQVINCLRVLTRTAIGIEDTPQDVQAVVDDAHLPAEIRAAFAPAAETVPAPPLAEEIAVGASTIRGMKAASAWLATQPWCDNPEQKQIARTLLAWESQQRSARLARLAAAEETGQTKATGIVSGANLSETTLLDYLRRKLDNPQLTISDYRQLSGGRTRKTVAFCQQGIAGWPQQLVVQCDPPVGYHIFPGVSSQYPALEYFQRSGKLLAPKPYLLELDAQPLGTPFMITERMPGSPPTQGINFFAPPPPSEALALDLARQMGALHSLSIEPLAQSVPIMLPASTGEGADWPADLDKLIASIAERTHGPSLTLSAALAWMRRNVDCVRDTRTLVHGDMMQQNLLTEGEKLTGILDWEAIRIGHPGEDLGYARPMVEQMTTWEKFMAAYREGGGPEFSAAEADYFTLRAYILMLTLIAGSRNAFEEGRVDDIRAAEVGCSLAPLFVNCVANTLDKILKRESGGN
jgi:aminoglycoside phosphotransferase (APT) family kinase protein